LPFFVRYRCPCMVKGRMSKKIIISFFMILFFKD
jgi:hypothetical protein